MSDRLSVQTAQNVDLAMAPAGLGERILAWLADIIIVIGYYLLAAWTLTEIGASSEWTYILVLGLPVLLYHLAFEVLLRGPHAGQAGAPPQGGPHRRRAADAEPVPAPVAPAPGRRDASASGTVAVILSIAAHASGRSAWATWSAGHDGYQAPPPRGARRGALPPIPTATTNRPTRQPTRSPTPTCGPFAPSWCPARIRSHSCTGRLGRRCRR